jgi:hypothetical protein
MREEYSRWIDGRYVRSEPARVSGSCMDEEKRSWVGKFFRGRYGKFHHNLTWKSGSRSKEAIARSPKLSTSRMALHRTVSSPPERNLIT